MFKPSTICFFVLGALLAGAAPAPLIIPSEAAPRLSNDQQSTMIREVRHELIMLPRYSLFDWVEFEVLPDNSVLLRGQVRGSTLRDDAEAAVKRIEGVTGVVNQIENLPPSPSDDQIRRSLYLAIYNENGPLFRYAIEVVPSIHIIVKNGNVVLKGVVDSRPDSDYAYLRAREVSQIFSVKNELAVEQH